jgi:hypothetical protein
MAVSVVGLRYMSISILEGFSDNCQVEKVDSVMFVCGCEFQGGVYVVNVVHDYFWGYFFGVVYYQYVVDISCVENYVVCAYYLFQLFVFYVL